LNPSKDDEYNNKVKISGLFETAMKILDSIRRFKIKIENKDKPSDQQAFRPRLSSTTHSIVILEEDEEDDPLEM
jgi:hypothetical protein